MKFIIVEERGLEQGIIFSEILSHKEVAGCKTVISGGFCSIFFNEEMKIQCWGESVSLRIKARPQDGDVLLKSLMFRA